MNSHVTTHVLNTSAGLPAAGIGIVLTDIAGTVLGQSVTDADGRANDIGPEALPPGSYTLTFATGDYFADLDTECFYPIVAITVAIPDEPAPHYHVPLLLSPFAYSTYRGS